MVLKVIIPVNGRVDSSTRKTDSYHHICKGLLYIAINHPHFDCSAWYPILLKDQKTN